MTTQLLEEEKSKEEFKQWCEGRFEIIREYDSHENKKENTNADFVIKPIKVDYGISIKTAGGDFTQGNFGAGVRGLTQWNKTESALKEVKAAIESKKSIVAMYPQVRWDELSNIEHHKMVVIKPFIDAYMNIFSDDKNVLTYCKYLTSRNADFLWKDGGLYRMKSFIPDTTKFSVKNKTINIPGVGGLRFKTSGGKIKDSIKINFEPCK